MQHFINPGQCQMTPVTGTGCSVKWKVQMRWENASPIRNPISIPGCVYLCWVAGVDKLSLVLVCPCPAPPLCPVPLSSLVWAAARRVKTLAHCCGLQRAEYYLVRARHNHPRSNSSVLCDKMRLDMRHRKSGIQEFKSSPNILSKKLS